MGSSPSLVKPVIATSAVHHGFEPQSGQTKEYQSGIFCFSVKNATLKRKSKNWLAWKWDNVPE
jgi:hypothetical protein